MSHPYVLQNTELSHMASAQGPSVMIHTATALQQGLVCGQLLHAGQKLPLAPDLITPHTAICPRRFRFHYFRVSSSFLSWSFDLVKS